MSKKINPLRIKRKAESILNFLAKNTEFSVEEIKSDHHKRKLVFVRTVYLVILNSLFPGASPALLFGPINRHGGALNRYLARHESNLLPANAEYPDVQYYKNLFELASIQYGKPHGLTLRAQLRNEPPPAEVRCRVIIAIMYMSALKQVPIVDLLSNSRKTECVLMRMAILVRVKQILPQMALPYLAVYIGRDRTTLVNMKNRHDAFMSGVNIQAQDKTVSAYRSFIMKTQADPFLQGLKIKPA